MNIFCSIFLFHYNGSFSLGRSRGNRSMIIPLKPSYEYITHTSVHFPATNPFEVYLHSMCWGCTHTIIAIPWLAQPSLLETPRSVCKLPDFTEAADLGGVDVFLGAGLGVAKLSAVPDLSKGDPSFKALRRWSFWRAAWAIWKGAWEKIMYIQQIYQ